MVQYIKCDSFACEIELDTHNPYDKNNYYEKRAKHTYEKQYSPSNYYKLRELCSKKIISYKYINDLLLLFYYF